jgi:hypothetical protein
LNLSYIQPVGWRYSKLTRVALKRAPSDVDILEDADILITILAKRHFLEFTMLAVLAAVALVVGGISTATVVASDDAAVQGSKAPVVEVQTIQPNETKSDLGNF